MREPASYLPDIYVSRLRDEQARAAAVNREKQMFHIYHGIFMASVFRVGYYTQM
jgi:hypothetical protein